MSLGTPKSWLWDKDVNTNSLGERWSQNHNKRVRKWDRGKESNTDYGDEHTLGTSGSILLGAVGRLYKWHPELFHLRDKEAKIFIHPLLSFTGWGLLPGKLT